MPFQNYSCPECRVPPRVRKHWPATVFYCLYLRGTPRKIVKYSSNHCTLYRMEDQGGSTMMGAGNCQILDAETLPQVHSGLSPNSDANNNSSSVPKTIVLPSYEEALASPRQIVIQDSYISAVYAPPYPPVYPCDHHPRRDCPSCLPQRCSFSRTGTRERRPRPRCSSRQLVRERSWPRILLFSFTFIFFLIMTSIIYNIILVEPFFYPDWCTASSCTPSTPSSNQ
uniref:Uncharacterized protein n=3 Tax=Lygus hesperus TaxID=30085 RepID=A0A0A9VQY9_LYGHE